MRLQPLQQNQLAAVTWTVLRLLCHGWSIYRRHLLTTDVLPIKRWRFSVFPYVKLPDWIFISHLGPKQAVRTPHFPSIEPLWTARWGRCQYQCCCLGLLKNDNMHLSHLSCACRRPVDRSATFETAKDSQEKGERKEPRRPDARITTGSVFFGPMWLEPAKQSTAGNYSYKHIYIYNIYNYIYIYTCTV